MAEFGRRLRKAREAKGWSTEKLAGESGISFGSVYAYENGKREPKVTQALAVARALGVSLDDLMAGIDEPSPPSAASVASTPGPRVAVSTSARKAG